MNFGACAVPVFELEFFGDLGVLCSSMVKPIVRRLRVAWLCSRHYFDIVGVVFFQ